jgi:hypothetical protein
MSRKGHYSGGSTIISARHPSRFKKGSLRTAANVSAPKPTLSLTEPATLQALKEVRETGTKLIPFRTTRAVEGGRRCFVADR